MNADFDPETPIHVDALVDIHNQLDRLNDNIERLLTNGIDVRTHAGICVAPPDDVVISSADAVTCREFLAAAIASGNLKLKGGAA